MICFNSRGLLASPSTGSGQAFDRLRAGGSLSQRSASGCLRLPKAPYFFNTFAIVSPISAGDSTT